MPRAGIWADQTSAGLPPIPDAGLREGAGRMGDRLHRPQPPQAGPGKESVCGKADDPTSSLGDSLRLPPALISTYWTLVRPYYPHKVDRLLGACLDNRRI